MTAQEFLESSTKRLREAGVPSARLDILVLMEDVLGRGRAEILAHPEMVVLGADLAKLNKFITQRQKHVPLAYIRGKVPFFGREFKINKHVLVPRPETETMVEILKKMPLPARPVLADVGSGSGCIGITAALEIPGSKALLYDIDPETLKVARQNIKTLGADARCIKSDLLGRYTPADVILANLPYVPERYAINPAAEHEPKHAIFGGKDGLNLYRRLFEQIDSLKRKPEFVLTEALPPQHQDLALIAKHRGYEIYASQDFIQAFRLADRGRV